MNKSKRCLKVYKCLTTLKKYIFDKVDQKRNFIFFGKERNRPELWVKAADLLGKSAYLSEKHSDNGRGHFQHR